MQLWQTQQEYFLHKITFTASPEILCNIQENYWSWSKKLFQAFNTTIILQEHTSDKFLQQPCSTFGH